MKTSIDLDKASRLINCGELILVSAAYLGSSTITPCAWTMPFSKNPALIGIALAKGHFSSQLIAKSKEFAINIPDWSLLDKVMHCGSVSGRNADKFKDNKLTPQKSTSIAAPKIKECIGNIECKLFDTKEIGDHFIFTGEALHAEAEEEYFPHDFWDTTKVSLILHLGGKFFFKSSPYTEFKRDF